MRERSKIYLAISMAMLIVLILCYGMAVGSYIELRRNTKDTVTAILDNGITGERIREIIKTEQEQDKTVLFAAWKEEHNVTAAGQEGIRSTGLNLIKAQGSLQLIFGTGSVLDEDDMWGCLLSEKAAEALFGSSDAAGKTVVCRDREYTVRGILKADAPVLAVRGFNGGQEKGAAYGDAPGSGKDTAESAEMLTLRAKDSLKEFMVRHSLSGRILELTLLAEIAQIFVIILPVVTAGCLAAVLVRGLLMNIRKRKRLLPAVWALLLIIVAAVLFITISKVLHIPSDIIPTKWSDFGFWSAWFKEKREAFLFLLQAGKSYEQAADILLFARCAGLSMISFVLYFFCARNCFFLSDCAVNAQTAEQLL